MADLLNIRDITVNDRDEYLSMYKNLYDSDATTTDYDEEIAILNFNNAISDSKSIRCLIFEYKDMVLGYAFLSFSYSTSKASQCIWLEDLFIKEPARKKGVGSYFMDWLVKEYKNKAKSVKLEVTKTNVHARRFYERLNFQESGYMQMYLEFK